MQINKQEAIPDLIKQSIILFKKIRKPYLLVKKKTFLAYDLFTLGKGKKSTPVFFGFTKENELIFALAFSNDPKIVLLEAKKFLFSSYGKTSYELFTININSQALNQRQFLVTNKQKKIQYFSSTALHLFNYTAAEIEKKSLKFLFQGKINPIKRNLNNSFFTNEYLAKRKNEETFICRFNDFKSKVKIKEISIYSIEDVTRERSHYFYENAREKKYQDIFSFAKVGIARVDSSTGRFLEVNNYLTTLLEVDEKSLLKSNFQDIIFNSSGTENLTINELKKIKPITSYFIAGKEKTNKYFQISSSLVKQSKQSQSYYLLSFHDITELHRKETEILYQTAKLKAIFQSKSHAIWIIDKKRNLVSFNSNFSKEINKFKKTQLKKEKKYSLNFSTIQSSSSFKWHNHYNNAFLGKSQQFEIVLEENGRRPQWREVFLEPIITDTGEINEVFGLAHDISQKKKNELNLSASLREKEILLKEVHHRVKNNMQVISSILSLQSGLIMDENIISILKECQNRIKSMALIHENLYRSKDFSQIRADEYLLMVINSTWNSYFFEDKKIILSKKLNPIKLDIDRAIPCGLIINELVTNSLKHGFKGMKKGKINVNLYLEDNKVNLLVQDNGVGFDAKNYGKSSASLGIQLVYALTEQIDGDLNVNCNKGASFLITFTL